MDTRTEYFDLLKSYLEKDVVISDVAFKDLVAHVTFKKFSKNEYLLRAGEISRNIYFVCKGIIVSEWPDPDGNLHIKNFFTEGDIAASTVSSLHYEPSNFNLLAIDDCLVMVIDYRKFKEVIYKHEDLKSFYIGYLERNWIVKNERRQISFAVENATDRYKSFLKNYPGLINRVSLKLISQYMGITPTQLSRIRKDY